jgi:hypothetical protein
MGWLWGGRQTRTRSPGRQFVIQIEADFERYGQGGPPLVLLPWPVYAITRFVAARDLGKYQS